MDNIMYNFSIIVIGRNSEKTLKKCIEHINLSVLNTCYIDKYEIIYVDSISTDNSLLIAEEHEINILKVYDGFSSASLGRYLGKKYSKYKNLVFIDSDMYLDENWFNNSLVYYKKFNAIIGERYEKLYKNNKVIKEIPRFYNITKVEVALSIGGFLMIKKDLVKDINYTPIIKNEEEKDFYAKFYHKSKIYKIPELAYIHNNYNLSVSRIKDYIYPYTKNGYILSLFNSIKNNYFMNYVSLQRKYIVSIVSSIIFFISIAMSCYIGSLISFLLLFFNGIMQLKGSVMTMLFFPYKFVMSLIFLKKKKIIYTYRKSVYKMNITVLSKDFHHISVDDISSL
jgi:glycosyltransferase involved in cell wall biosynthesis